MAQRLRIFISSPGDVPDERLRADLIIDKLAQDYSRYFAVESYRWEHEPMLASGHFQDAIEPPSASDIVILILWSRLGTPLPEKTATREYRGLDGRAPVTGTEWEFEEALAAARLHGAPDILVFRNSSPTTIDSRDPAARTRSLEQLDALDAFWKRYFADRGVFLAGASEYRDIEDFAARLEESLRKLVERRIKARAASGAGDAAPTWLGNPFRGLQAYEFEHAAIFFGRDALVAKAAEQLTAQARAGSAFLLVVGASGSGKSSLIKAALVPRLMKPQRIEGAAFLRRMTFRPGDAQDDLILGFAEALTKGPAQDGIGLPELLAPGQTAKDLAGYLRANLAAPTFAFTSALGRVTEVALAAKRILPHESARIVIMVDQLEELFTLSWIGAEDRRAFVRLLHGLTHSGAVWVVATMRADFWHRILDEPELLALAEGPGRLEIPTPSQAEIAEVIRKPAQAAGLKFETGQDSGLGLDTVLAEHAASEPGVLPLLSFTLDALYREDIERGGGHELTFAQYDHLGGLEGAIANRADEVVNSLPGTARAAVPRVLRALATLGGVGNETPVARSVPLASFAPGTDARAVVDALVAARLLVASSEGATATVRLAHEALIGRWQRARDQLTADRRDLETRSLIERQFARWHQAEDSNREQLLLRDPDLANALDLERRWGDELGANVRDFIARSHRRRRRRQQFAAAAAVVFGIVALAATVFGVIAYRAQQQAELARTRAVAAESTAVTERDQAVQQRNAALVSQSRYLATEADSLVKDGQVRQAIALLRVALPDPERGNKRPLVRDAIAAAYGALYANRERGRVALPQDATAFAMTPDGKSQVIAAPDRIVVRAAGSEEERVLPHRFGPVSRLVVNGAGERVAMVGPGGAISVRRLADNRELMTFAGEGAGTQAFLLAGGQRLLAVSPDNKIWHLLDVETGRELTARTLGAAAGIVAQIDPERGIMIAIADGRIYRLSGDDLSDQATAPVEAAADYALALAPDGPSIYLATAQDIMTGRISVLDGETLAVQRTFGKVVGGARHVAVGPRSKWLAVHGIIGIDFFDIATGERLYHMLTTRDATRGRFFGPSGSDYIAYGPNGFVRRYAPEFGVEMAAYRMVNGGAVDQIHELPDRSGFVAITDRPSATVWSYDSQIIARQYTVPLVIRGMDMGMPSLIEAFSIANDRDEVLASYIDRSVRRWTLATGDVRTVREAPPASADAVDHVASLAGGISVLAEKSGRLLVFTDAGGAARPTGELALEPLAYLADLGDARAFAVTKTGAALVIDVSSPAQPSRQAVPALATCALQVAVPGRAVCIDAAGTIRAWDARAARLTLEWPVAAPARLSAGYASADGSLFAAGFSNGEVVVRSLADGKTILSRTLTVELTGDALVNAARNGRLSAEDAAKVRQGAKTLEVAIGPTAMVISPDRMLLAVGTLDRSVRLIDLASGDIRRTAAPYRGMAQDLAFSPNGALLAAVETSDYRALNVYDVASGDRLISISLGSQASPQLRHLDNGKGFATIDKGGRIFVYPVFQDWQDLVAYLAAEYPEPLTPRQRRAFFIE